MDTEKRREPPTPLMRDEKIIEQPVDQQTLTRRYTEESIAFIRRNKDKPFFLYLAQTFPHVPLYASDDFRGKSARGLYGDVVEELDWSVGQVLQALRDETLAERTLVVFTSDNGPWLIKNEQGGSAGQLRDGKGTTWEGGMRVPGIVWWPGRVKAGMTSHNFASQLDLLPTFVTLAGAWPAKDLLLDGDDISQMLLEDKPLPHRAFFYYAGTRLNAVRKGPWKIHFTTGSPLEKKPAQTHRTPLLFHLKRDPSERWDVAKDNPAVVADLVGEAERHRQTVVPIKLQLEEWAEAPAPVVAPLQPE
jgi:arylsulfatase A-like enzyme